MKQVYMATLCLYLVSLPLNAINIGPFGSALKVLAIFPVFFAVFSGNPLRINSMVGWLFVFTAFACLSIFWSVYLGGSFPRAITYILLFLLLVSGTFFDYTKKDIDTVQKALVWSSRITAVVVFLFAGVIEGRLILKNSIIQEDPNYICCYYAFGIIYALSALTKKARPREKVFAALELLAYMYLVFASGSRGGLLAVGTGVLTYLLFFRGEKRGSVTKRIVVMVVLYLTVDFAMDFLPAVLQERFDFQDAIESGASGRLDIWDNALHLFKNSNLLRQIFGQGTATVRWCMNYYHYSMDNVVHNMFLETLVELGVVGLILYSVAIFAFVKKALSQQDKFAFAVIMSMVVLSLSTSIYTFKPYFHIMLYIIICSNALPNRGECNETENNLCSGRS